MCFSATASFVAGGALGAGGGLTMAEVKIKAEMPLASIPLIFGIQQTIEGVIWVSFGVPLLNTVMTYVYLTFAYVLWPVFVPVAVVLRETDPARRNILRALSLAGFVLGMFLLYFIVTDPGKAHIVNQSIAYDYRHLYELFPLSLYVVVTCGSGLISSHRILNIFAIGALISFFIANWLFNMTFISVWCFFAAVLSVLIYWHFKRTSVAGRQVEAG